MDIAAIEQLLYQYFPNAEIEIATQGSHLDLVITSDQFTGLTPLKRQQKVYAALNDKIASGEVHAVTMKTRVP